MKKIIIALVVLVIGVGTGVYYWYQNHFSTMVAEAVISDELPPYIPKYVQAKINEFRGPVNASAEKLVEKMHTENIPITEVIETIDNASEEQTNAFIQELSETKITSTNQVFDLYSRTRFPFE